MQCSGAFRQVGVGGLSESLRGFQVQISECCSDSLVLLGRGASVVSLGYSCSGCGQRGCGCHQSLFPCLPGDVSNSSGFSACVQEDWSSLSRPLCFPAQCPAAPVLLLGSSGGVLVVDALPITWPSCLLYAFLPLALIPRFLARLGRESREVVVPFWPCPSSPLCGYWLYRVPGFSLAFHLPCGYLQCYLYRGCRCGS